MKEVIDRLSPQIIDSSYSVIIDAKEFIIGNWDRSKVEQILTNLMTNALKYGQGKPIHLSIKRDGKNVILKVQDQGSGIAINDQKRIFERFERAISFDEVSGLGLGLYIANQIAIAHGGYIKVESVMDIGSTFTVSLPLE